MTQFSAGAQALGYIYQARYSLYLILSSSEDQQGITMETLDDIVLASEGSPQELLQLKHSSQERQANLTDSSPDLWKTLRVWSDYLQQEAIDLSKITLTLVTTATASATSVASLLKIEKDRDPEQAYQRLIKVAQNSKNEALKKCFDTFLALTEENRKHLIHSIYILDQSSDISDLEGKIKHEIRYATRPKHLPLLYERLEGWWFGKVINYLRKGFTEPITLFEVRNQINEIADQFKEEALPIDFYNLAVPDDFDAESRIFIHQLRQIAVQERRIRKAIQDYYRAFQQRSRWIRENLVFTEELEEYEQKLIDEWERYWDRLRDEEEFDFENEEDCRRFGRKVFGHIDGEVDTRIRREVSEPYVIRGSYHILADKEQPKVHWHPKFLEKLTQLLSYSSSAS